MIGEKKHVVFVSEYVNSDANSTGEYFFDILYGLLNSGVRVSLVTPCTDLNRKAIEQLEVNFSDLMSVTYVSSVKERQGASLAKALGSIGLTFSLWRRAKISVTNDSTLFFGTNPTFLIAVARFWPIKVKSRVVILCYDVFPDNLIAVSKSFLSRFVGHLLTPVFKSSYRVVDKALVIGRCMAEKIIAIGVPRERVKVVSNWADPDEIRVLEFKSKTPDKVHFQFFGNIGPLQGIEQLLEAFQYVKSNNVHFSFIGRGANIGLVARFIENNSTLVEVTLEGAVPKETRCDVLSNCDIAVVSLDERITGLGVPSKTYYSLAAGRPLLILASESAEPSLLVKEFQIGWHAHLSDPKEIARKIDEICNQTERPSPEYVRSVFEANFSKQIAVQRVVEELCH